MKYLFFYAVLTFTPFELFSQDDLILKGVIISEELEYLSGIIVYDTDTVVLAFSDESGYFEITSKSIPKELLLSGMGVEWTRISINENCEDVEIIMLLLYNYDFISLRKMNKDRLKRFKNRNKIFREASNLGLFISCGKCVSYFFDKW